MPDGVGVARGPMEQYLLRDVREDVSLLTDPRNYIAFAREQDAIRDALLRALEKYENDPHLIMVGAHHSKDCRTCSTRAAIARAKAAR